MRWDSNCLTECSDGHKDRSLEYAFFFVLFGVAGQQRLDVRFHSNLEFYLLSERTDRLLDESWGRMFVGMVVVVSVWIATSASDARWSIAACREYSLLWLEDGCKFSIIEKGLRGKGHSMSARMSRLLSATVIRTKISSLNLFRGRHARGQLSEATRWKRFDRCRCFHCWRTISLKDWTLSSQMF